jgi:catechol 2,3-dioxygenase-like lactoylglutathione lyase family enzyme
LQRILLRIIQHKADRMKYVVHDDLKLNYSRHPVLDMGLGFPIFPGRRGSQAPCQARGDDSNLSLFALVGVALAALLTGCATSSKNEIKSQQTLSAPGVEKPTERVPTDIRRLTILVRDMETSLKLYRDVLGLKVNYDAPLTTSGVALPAGVPGNKVRLVLLNSNDAWVGWIGLMQYIDPPLAGPEPYPKRLGAGAPVLVTNTDDAQMRCAMAKSVPGVTFTAEARLQVYPGRNGGPPIRVMGCNFFDPDGLLIELNQILK